MFNLSNNGKVVAKISGGRYDGKLIYCCNEDAGDTSDSEDYESKGMGRSSFNYVNIKKHNGKLEPTPDTTRERDISYICACSGSGKSFYTKLYIKNYIKAYPKNNIYLFSKLKNDESLDDIKKIQRVKIDEDLIKDPVELDDLTNSLVVFDDIDTITNKLLKDALLLLQDDILQCGRHKNVSCVITSHLATKGNETKIILSEAHNIVLFLGSGQNYDYILNKYLGYTTKEIQALKRLKSRWVSFCRHYPQIIFTEYEVIPQKDLLKDK